MEEVTRAFAEHARRTVEGGPALEAALRRAIEAARAERPECAVDDARFAAFLAERLPDGGDAVSAIDRLRAGDLLLACACAHGDARAIAAFDAEMLAPAAAALVRAGAPPAAVDDALQAIRERLFVQGKIADYSGRGALAGWARVALARAQGSMRRGEKPAAPLDDAEALPSIDPELAIVRRKYQGAFTRAFQTAFAALTTEQRCLFRMHFVDGLNLDRLAVVLGVSRATAGRRMLEAKRAVLERTLAELRAELRVTPTELKSLLGIVKSKLEVSLSGLLREAE